MINDIPNGVNVASSRVYMYKVRASQTQFYCTGLQVATALLVAGSTQTFCLHVPPFLLYRFIYTVYVETGTHVHVQT